VSRLLLAFVAIFNIALAALSLSTLAQEVANSDAIVIGQRIVDSKPISSAAVTKLANGPEMQNLRLTCRTDILRYGLWTYMVALDIANSGTDNDSKRQLLADAGAFVAHMERCSPANGQVWLRDAMLLHASNKMDMNIFLSKAMLSTDLAPNSGFEIAARINLWNSLSPQELEKVSDLAIRDLAVGLAYYEKADARKLLLSPPDNLKPLLPKALSSVPQARVHFLIDQMQPF